MTVYSNNQLAGRCYILAKSSIQLSSKINIQDQDQYIKQSLPCYSKKSTVCSTIKINLWVSVIKSSKTRNMNDKLDKPKTSNCSHWLCEHL